MSALRMIAWGMVDLDKISRCLFKELRGQVRDELRQHQLGLKAAGMKSYRLYRPRLGDRRCTVCVSELRTCCQRALEIIEPQNYSEG